MVAEIGYSDRDLARIALARQAARLADRLHEFVCQHGHEVPAGTWLGSVVSQLLEESDALHRLAVDYERSLGTTWEQIGEISGVTGAEAEQRWGRGAPALTAEQADAAAAQLDHWYIRHLWLDVVKARRTNPFTRLLDGGAEGDTASCLICRKYDGGTVPAWAGRRTPPGGHLIENQLWRAGHAPTVFAPAGALLVESRRHLLDFGEMTPEESASYATVVGRLIHVIKKVTGAERVHIYSNMEGTPHFHVWLLPRRPDDIKGRGFIGNVGFTTEQEAAKVVARMRELLNDEHGALNGLEQRPGGDLGALAEQR